MLTETSLFKILAASKEHNAHPAYRPDIDGLRAVAILSVVTFHAFPTLLRGGFIGVDIFFVISGFLISSIIFRSLRQGDFSFAEFYAHRIKRIFPALVVVLAASYVFGWFALLPDEFRQLGKHMAAGAGFVQNIVLWTEAGYFDTTSELKPLMHLWSLAIEEQFYLIYPLLIGLAWRLRLNVLAVVATMGLVSLYLNVTGIGKDAVRTFFMPQTRFWELLAGAALAYGHSFEGARFSGRLKGWILQAGGALQPSSVVRRDAVLRNLLSLAGFLLLLAAVLAIHKSRLFPGWWAAVPVMGAFLLILAGPGAWVNRRILSHRGMVLIGLISYPLYLWHWPILAFARIIASDNPSAAIRAAAVALSVLLAWLTYRLVEKPIRFGRRTWVKTAVLSLLIAVAGYVGYDTYQKNGLESRPTVTAAQPKMQDLAVADMAKLGYTKCTGSPVDRDPKLGYCLLSHPAEAAYAIVGDSHGENLFHGVAKNDANSWLLIGNTSCPPVAGIHVQGTVSNCDVLMEKALDYLAKSPSIQTVVFSFFGNYPLETNYAADHVVKNVGPKNIRITSAEFKTEDRAELFYLGLDRAISGLEQASKSIVLVIDIPELPYFPKDCIGRPLVDKVRNCTIARLEAVKRQGVQRQIFDRLQKTHPNLRIYDSLSALCDQESCYAESGDFLLYRDSHHLSLRGSDFFAQRFLAWLYH